ncbi:MAG: NAD(P)-binding domain-containing protein [Hyphomicrobiaceae bacterium]
MQSQATLKSVDPSAAAIQWLETFEQAVRRNDVKAAADLFADDCHWRDLVAFTWHIDTVSGRSAIETALAHRLPTVKPSRFRLAEGRTPPRVVKRAGMESVEALIAFETSSGRGSGVLRLVPGETGTLKAWILLTTLDEIKGHEERIGPRRPRGEEWSGGFGGENWMDHRNKAVAYKDREPAVVVIGGSQSGLGIAACLNVLGIDTLVIDRHERVGDAWRKRYHNLTLHNEVYVDHMPYMPFPPNYPVYIPRDKIANWLEFYADTMEINIWLSTEFLRGTYDEKAGRYALTVKRADGTERILRPRHVVFATGVSAIPIMPQIPGLETFSGEIMHSAHYDSGKKWKGKKAVVLGTGNSGHDVAHDLCVSGVDTTMVQRNSTLIVSLKEAQRVYELYQEGLSTDECDLIGMASPYPVLVQGYKIAAALCKEADRKLLEGLAARGFVLDNGPPDDTGFQMKYLRRGGGYYFNVGCSDLIVEGRIGLIQHRDIERVVPNGFLMKDGRTVAADLIVAATGYKNQQDVVRHFMGDEIADRIGEVWDFDGRGELNNMWRRTPQPGLWFVGGGLPHVRIFSKFLAQQIKAVEEGLIGALYEGPKAAPMRTKAA